MPQNSIIKVSTVYDRDDSLVAVKYLGQSSEYMFHTVCGNANEIRKCWSRLFFIILVKCASLAFNFPAAGSKTCICIVAE